MNLLIVEDERELSNALAVLLEHQGYQIDVAYDGEEGLNKIHSNYYDGMVFDRMMPKMDGVRLLQTIRSEGNTTPVILLTAKSEVEDRVEGLNAGANDYLSKPFSMKELIARIEAMLRSSSASTSGELHFKDVLLKKDSEELQSKFSVISLCRKEVNLLTVFFKTPGKLIEKNICLSQLGPDADLKELKIYIAYLNNKLASIKADTQIIETAEGYLLSD